MVEMVWVLGSEHPNADRSIPWGQTFPNFAECDILIVNLTTLNNELFQETESELFRDARKYIFDLLMTGDKQVIAILSSEQQSAAWLPLFPILTKTARIGVHKASPQSHISEFMKTVEACSFYIHEFSYAYVRERTSPESEHHENYRFTNQAFLGYRLNAFVNWRIMNKAKQMVGGSVSFIIKYGSSLQHIFRSGFLYLLPPPTKLTAEQAIDIMLSAVRGGESMEPPPEWETKVELPGLQELSNQISQRKSEIEILERQVSELDSSRSDLTKFRRLLWANGVPLENAVRDAFLTLGFSEIRKIRESNLEDWVIDFKHVSEYKHGVFEVKGADKRTSLSDMNQCDKWVKDYLLEKNQQVKGIFVSNQHRNDDVHTNREQREHFEPNELKFAGQREICILPSHELFYATIKKIDGSSELTRKLVEEKIAKSNGICRLSEI